MSLSISLEKALAVLQELKECAEYWGEYEVPIGIHERIDDAIEELLAQPEQSEQEPVGIVVTIGGYPDDSEHTVKLTCRYRDLKHGDLLYTSSPKREPLSDEILYPIAEERINDEGIAGFYDGFRCAEKHYKIGE
jgi:hypothetical protein